MKVANVAACHPVSTILTCILLSLALATTGYLTNFTVTVDVESSFTPVGSYPSQHRDWIYNYDKSQFPQERIVVLVLHADGNNACAAPASAALDKVFEAVSAIRDLPAYPHVCRSSSSSSENGDDEDICEMLGVTGFWDDSLEVYQQQVHVQQQQQGNNAADTIARQVMSGDKLSNGIPVAENLLFGHAARNNATNLIEFCESFTITIRLPETDAAYEFETDVLAAVLELDEQWANEPGNNLRMAINVKRSFEDE